MDRNYEEPAVRFALEILRQHPQISYEHAVAAAAYAGVQRLPRDAFWDAADRLGIPRDHTAVEPAQALGVAGPRGLGHEPSDASADLLAKLDACRRQATETGKVRDALERMRRVVRAALADS